MFWQGQCSVITVQEVCLDNSVFRLLLEVPLTSQTLIHIQLKRNATSPTSFHWLPKVLTILSWAWSSLACFTSKLTVSQVLRQLKDSFCYLANASIILFITWEICITNVIDRILIRSPCKLPLCVGCLFSFQVLNFWNLQSCKFLTWLL